ncbi:BTAD domain-containing putative transcriptional regulator [Nocardia huaxiensis]|uniref:BTAD domain-containing putative transcriptional regulator n=1 Tax=Nocardia huaxiensis TaxID=2755382 RepID=UPI001C66433B|nr:BTAD domain-containing putative transcriptional regulator [Nocardia huaxiensis]
MVTVTDLDIRLLGPVQLTVNGRPVPVRGRKPQVLLAMLTINRRRGVSAPLLVDTIWDDEPPGRAMAGLHGYVAALRRELRSAGADPGTVLRTVAAGCYRLDIADDQCDIGRFEHSRSAGMVAAARGDHAAATADFTTALAQWSGEPLAGLHGIAFAERFAVDVTEWRLSVVTARADAEFARGHATSVLDELTALAAAHPLREGLWQRLIRALHASGRHADGLAVYHRIRRNLAEELGADPDPETDALRDAIVHRRPPLPPQPASRHTATLGSGSAPIAALRGPDGRTVEITERGLRIGRGADNDLVLDDTRVSRTHARLVVRCAGLVIHDLASTNGVYVNGDQIPGSARVSEGDVIALGGTCLRVESLGAGTRHTAARFDAAC